MDALKLISESSMKSEVPAFEVGDTVKVHVRIKEGQKYRIQVFEGTVIAKRHGGIQETFTVRRVAHGCGIERVFPVHSPVVTPANGARRDRAADCPFNVAENRSTNLAFSSRGHTSTDFKCLFILTHLFLDFKCFCPQIKFRPIIQMQNHLRTIYLCVLHI